MPIYHSRLRHTRLHYALLTGFCLDFRNELRIKCDMKREELVAAVAGVDGENVRMITGVFRDFSAARKRFEVSGEGI